MLAHMDTAAQCSLFRCFVLLFVYMLFLIPTIFSWANDVDGWHEREEYYSRVSPLTRHTGGCSEESRLSMDYHPCGKEAEVAQGEETKARLQGWCAIEAM